MASIFETNAELVIRDQDNVERTIPAGKVSWCFGRFAKDANCDVADPEVVTAISRVHGPVALAITPDALNQRFKNAGDEKPRVVLTDVSGRDATQTIMRRHNLAA